MNDIPIYHKNKLVARVQNRSELRTVLAEYSLPLAEVDLLDPEFMKQAYLEVCRDYFGIIG